MVYCEGSNCDKKNTCKFHTATDDANLREHIDFSACASGTIDNTGSNIRNWCGRDGYYMKYEPIEYPTTISISTLRKAVYENWNYYNYERYNRCPKCNFSFKVNVK